MTGSRRDSQQEIEEALAYLDIQHESRLCQFTPYSGCYVSTCIVVGGVESTASASGSVLKPALFLENHRANLTTSQSWHFETLDQAARDIDGEECSSRLVVTL